jgi:DNA-directed RNA polymerase specialized sigma24 family protein
MIPLSTHSLLKAWAQWGASHHIGYPRMSPMFGERALKTPLFPTDYCPPDVVQIEAAVCQVDPDERQIIISRYQWHMTVTQMAHRLGCSRSSARRKIDKAQWAVHVLYCRT